MNIIHIEKLNLCFNKSKSKEFCALKDIDLQIKKGEFCILKGVSGSGKSTLLAVIAALIKPSSGKIEVDKKPISKMPDFHRSNFRQNYIGFVFQNFNLFEELTVYENVKIPLIPTKNENKDIKNLLDKLGLKDKQNSYVKELSGGEKQRVAIARALVNEPKLILADEPTANLDRQNSLNIIQMLKDLHKEGKTIIVATHDDIFQNQVDTARIISLEDGKIV